MTEDTSLISALQLHHGFKVIPYINLVNSIESLLNRCLRKKCIEKEVNIVSRTSEVSKIVDWIPKVWKRLNDCFQRIKSSVHTVQYSLSIEPFLSCPFHVKETQKWFDDLWNFIIIPWFKEVLKNCDRTEFESTYRWVIQSYPWSDTKRIVSLKFDDSQITNLRSKDLQDSLTSTLIKLKKASDA
ncbi:hypothetical protein B4U80_01071 [Leptotrombidium deliense]|uniref:CortBP2/NAV1-like AAA+ ATPase lid domain-containing protein n=1 Tax=Leptotrombidium deliense TaxID=299467 RepID=A0A443SA08_9ACAR|nr:hypothetical protein B4U80_01071 [Leptotrombidium deliense]